MVANNDGGPPAEPTAGPTGEFPNGKLNEEDAGGLHVAIAADPEKNVVHVQFGTTVRWVALPPEDAKHFGRLLMARGLELSPDSEKELMSASSSYRDLETRLLDLPSTWFPQLLTSLIKAAHMQNVFKSDGFPVFAQELWQRLEGKQYEPWEERPGHPVADWRQEVVNDDTRLGYVEWCLHREDAAREAKEG